MVGIHPDILEVVVLTTSSNALLGISSSSRLVGARYLSQENRDELVHPCIGEQQVRRIGHQAGGLDDAVLFGLKEIEKGLADLGTRHHGFGETTKSERDQNRMISWKKEKPSSTTGHQEASKRSSEPVLVVDESGRFSSASDSIAVS
jgi:hypothetical protein